MMAREASGLWVPEHGRQRIVSPTPEHGIVQARGFRGAPIAAMMGGAARRLHTMSAPSSKFATEEPDGMTVYVNDAMDVSYVYTDAVSPRGGAVITNAADAGQASAPTSQQARWAIGQGHDVGFPDTSGGGLYKSFPVAAHPRRAFFSFWLKPASSTEWHGSFNKIAWLGTVGEPNYVGISLVIGCQGNGRLAIVQQYHGNVATGIVHSSGASGAIVKGSWNRISIETYGNDADVSNGILRMYLGGVQVFEKLDMDLASAGQIGRCSGALLDAYWGGDNQFTTAAFEWEYDHIYLSGKDT